MTSPSSTIYVRPGWASSTWTYAGMTMPSGVSSSGIVAVSFDASSALGEAFSRGAVQYSTNNGQTWTTYTLPVDAGGAYVTVAGTLFRFQDTLGSDTASPDTFSVHYKLADNSVVTVEDTVLPDSQPVGIVGSNDVVFTTAHAGDVVDTLSPIDTGAASGGRWVIDSQSTPGLFAISYNPATDSVAKVVVANPALLPADGQAASVTVHYYDMYQVGTDGQPAAGTGVTQVLTYSVEAGSTDDLAGFGSATRIGAATDAYNGQPALATLSTGGFVAVWQAPDTVAGGAGAGLWAQLRDAAGNATGAAFALTPDGDGRIEGQPAVSALAGGRFVVAYTVNVGGVGEIAYRVVEANGSAGAEHILDTGGSGDAAMPTVATLADGSFVVGWRSGADVHVQQAAAADGALVGSQHVYAALGSAYSPAIAALGSGYVVSWGEMNDGNVYAALSTAPSSVFVASGDGYAASITTAAPLPHVTALAGGGFVVAWDSYANDPWGFTLSDIYFQRYDAGGHAVGAVTQANVDSGGGHYDADVVALSDGGFMVAWQGGDGDANGIYGRRFGADGTPEDSQEFAINQLRAGDQASPDITALAGGGFAAAWVDTSASGAASIETRVLAGSGATTTPAGGSGTQSSGATGTDSSSGSAPATGTSGSGTSGSGTSSSGTSSSDTSSGSHSSGGTSSGGTSSGSTSSGSISSGTTSGGGVPTSGSSGDSAPASGSTVTSIAFDSADHTLSAVSGSSQVTGSTGLDTLVYKSARAGATIVESGNIVSVTDAAGNHATLTGVERLQFSDGMVALDINGDPGEAYRLYQAAFGRTPDKAGLGYWIEAMDKGVTLAQAAAGFVDSAEFVKLYGANSTDAQFVTALYQNVLHRPLDSAGYDFWVQSLHSSSRADVLVGFSESAENQAQVVGSIQNGIDYLHWAG